MSDNGDLGWITNYIWGIADDVLRDLYVRGKYRDVILPMTVLRRLDAVLEDSKQAVLGMKATLDAAGIVEQDSALRQAAGQAFYNTSPIHPARSAEPAPAASNSPPTSKPISTASRPTWASDSNGTILVVKGSCRRLPATVVVPCAAAPPRR